jgi:hypothetical protein
MKRRWVLVGAAAVLSCASSGPKTNLVFQIDAPSDSSCIGVAGFEVVITSPGRNSDSHALRKSTTALDNASCHLDAAFTIDEVNVDAPASVFVTGHDGAGAIRVQATGSVDNLHAQPTHLQLKATTTPPVLVIRNRSQMLTGPETLADVTGMTIARLRGNTTILTVTAGDYFLVEPGAYGVSGLAMDSTDVPLDITVDLMNAQGSLVKAKRTATWNPAGYFEVP